MSEKHSLSVGVILPLTGINAEYGVAVKNGLELATKDHFSHLEHVKFLFEDTGYDPKLAVASFKKLVDIDHVDLIYTWGVVFCKTLSPLAEQAKVPMVNQCIDAGSSAHKKYVTRFMNYSDQYLVLDVQYLRKAGLKKIAMVTTENAYLEELFEALKRTLLPEQTILLADRYRSTDMDFRPTIAKIRSARPDVIGVFLSVGQVSQFYKQLREQKLDIPTFGPNLFESLSEVKAAHGAMAGAVFASNSIDPDFAQRFEQEFKNVSQLAFGALAYEFGILLGDLSSDDTHGPLDGLNVLKEIEALADRKGVAVKQYSSKKHSIFGSFIDFPLAMHRISGEKFVEEK